MADEPIGYHRQQMMEELAMEALAIQTETQRIANSWPRIIRAAVWPNLDKVFVCVSTHSTDTVVVSLELDTARQFRDNLDKLIELVATGGHKISGGGYPPPYKPERDN